MAMLSWLHALDLHALYLINVAWSRPWLDPVMARISDFDSWRYPIAAAVLLTLIFGGFRGRLLLVTMVVCLIVGDRVIDWGFKVTVHRPRPSETEAHLRVVSVYGVEPSQPRPTKKGRSFTSGHACNNVALAYAACAIFGRRALILWLWAALVSYSRVYCAAHYPSDIVGSWAVAILYSAAIVGGMEWLWQRWGRERFPALQAAHPRLFRPRPAPIR